MQTLHILLGVLVFVGCGEAQLKCALKDFYLNNRDKCITSFITKVQQTADCSSQVDGLRDCMTKQALDCGFPENQTRQTLEVDIREDKVCRQSPVTSSNMTAIAKYCQKGFIGNYTACSKTIDGMWSANPKDPKLCGEYSKASSCAKTLIDKMCNFAGSLEGAVTKMALDVMMDRKYNPFCVPSGAVGLGSHSIVVYISLGFLSLLALIQQ